MPAGTLTAVAVIAALVVGFGAGWGLRDVPDPAAALAAQAETLAAIQSAQGELVESIQRPIVIDSEIRSQLADVPVQCRSDAGGSALSIACQWATCLQFGQTAAQRPECSAVRDLMVASMSGEGCPD